MMKSLSHLVSVVLLAVVFGQLEAPEMVPRITPEGQGRRNEESRRRKDEGGRRKEESIGGIDWGRRWYTGIP
jgi:hypothetical protein